MSFPLEGPLPSDLCPVCQQVALTAPTPCIGHHTPANEGRVFQKCPRNTFRPDTPCPGYLWRDDLSPFPWGNAEAPPMTPGSASRKGSGGYCQNPTCSMLQRSTHARAVNVQCVQQFCQQCCVATPRHCRVSSHNQPLIASPSSSFATSPPSLSFDITSPYSARISPSHPISHASRYARMIAPDVAQKLLNHDFSLSPSNRGQKEAYRLEAACMITVKWWLQDCSAITTRVGDSCNTYEYLQLEQAIEFTLEIDDCWILTPSAIKVKPAMILYLRSPGVKLCFGLRIQALRKNKKRALSAASLDTPTTPTKKLFFAEARPLGLARLAQRQPPTKDSKATKTKSCFKRMASMRGSVDTNFLAVFGTEYHSSTYSHHHKAWRCTEKPGLAAAIRAGRHLGGEWAPIANTFRR
ncbi:hypothetical protein FB451DRAFT_1427210 [Mycena latifolia]|nr:hypothetical protein FB451DRAFT_1427210 [Mycena latifolia]